MIALLGKSRCLLSVRGLTWRSSGCRSGLRFLVGASPAPLDLIVRQHVVKNAAIVYVVSAVAVLGVVLYLLVEVGVGVGLLILTLIAGALLVLARGLIRGKSGASNAAIAVSSFVALGFFLIPLYCYVQGGWTRILLIWPLLAPFAAFAIAHSVALASLLGTKSNAA